MSLSIVEARNYGKGIVEESLSEGFRLLGMDDLNPFKDLIKPGDTVFIKPNWCNSKYRVSCLHRYDVFTTITHPVLIREIARKVDIALAGKGEIIIGDNPIIDADFDELMEVQDLSDLQYELKASLRILDLRPLICDNLEYYGQKDRMIIQPGDPKGETIINLGNQSQLYKKDSRLFHGIFDTHRKETRQAHAGENHLYGISNSILYSDVFISVPKLKTHHKVGVSLNLKGLVGIVGRKNFLVHWKDGFPFIGGDAYPNISSWFKDKFRKIKSRGSWDGNDTIWRMVVDLYTCMQRYSGKSFTIIDGILGGEENGPFCPKPKWSKVIIMGDNLLEADIVASRLMGFIVENIKYLNYYLSKDLVRKENIEVCSVLYNSSDIFDDSRRHLAFKEPTNWEGLLK